MARRFSLLSWLLVVGCWVGLVSGAFVVDVAYEDEVCFLVRLPADQRSLVSGSFEVMELQSADDAVKVFIYDQRMNPLWKSPLGTTSGTFALIQPPGRVSICIQNGLTDLSRNKNNQRDAKAAFSAATVALAKQLKVSRQVGLEVRVAKSKPTSGMEQQVSKIQNKLYDLKSHQSYMRVREEIHRNVAEQTFSYVMRWNVVETLTVLAVSAAQILYLRRFFETKRYV